MYKDTDIFDHTNITLKNYKDLVFYKVQGGRISTENSIH